MSFVMRMLFLASALLAGPAVADVTGRASVIDGDTLEIRGERVRLWGVDAPESRQTCRDAAGRDYRCGQIAANALSQWIGHRSVVCRERERDRYGRAVSSCTVGGRDVAGWLALNGHAIDYGRYSGGRYAGAEAKARAGKLGMWAGSFQKPWEWRAEQRDLSSSRWSLAAAPPASVPPTGSGCLIKGNISRKGDKIYHSPGMRSYEATQISPGKGERWFCSEAEARAAGWRAPRG